MTRRKDPEIEEPLNAESLVWFLAKVLRERVESEEIRCNADGSFSRSLLEISQYDKTSSDDAFAVLTFTNGILTCTAYRPSELINYIAARILKILAKQINPNLISDELHKELSASEQNLDVFCLEDFVTIKTEGREIIQTVASLTAHLPLESAELSEEIEKLTQTAARIENYFNSRLAERINRVIDLLFDEAFELEFKGKVSLKTLNMIRDFLTKGVKRGAGGDTRSKYHWTEQEREQLKFHHTCLSKFYQNGKSIFRKTPIKTLEGFKAWCDMFNAELFAKEKIKLEVDLMRFWFENDEKTYIYNYRPSYMAIEHAARLSKSEYKHFDLNPRDLTKYLSKAHKPQKRRVSK